jgi:methionyl aminopeptidase
VSIRSTEELEGLKTVGRIVALALREMSKQVVRGITTAELDRVGAMVLAEHGARSAPVLVYGFPAAICIGVNDQAIHGIPGSRLIRPGDLVKLDVTAERGGYMADAAKTLTVPPASDEACRLAKCAEIAFRKALVSARAGHRIWEIGMAVEAEVQRRGFRVIRQLCGHGIGRTIHEDPQVPNYADPACRGRLHEGLVITVEPIIAAGNGRPVLKDDGWTVRTSDGRLAAHYEHTIVITRDMPILLTEAA